MIRLILSALLLIHCANAFAILDLVVKEKLQVYKKPKSSSKVVTVLVRGDRVVISPVSYSGFKKVLVTYEGKRQAGYIPAKNIKLSVIEDRNKVEGSPIVLRKNFGAYAALSYNNQAETELDLSGFPGARVGGASGFPNFWGLYYQMPILSKTVLQMSLSAREFFTQGTGEVIPDGGQEILEKTEKMYTAGVFAKRYGTNGSIFWTGAGAEIAMVQDVEVKIEGGSSFEFTGENATYILLNAGLGFDIKAYDKVFIIPELRVGAAVNASPFIFYGDLMVGVSYVF